MEIELNSKTLEKELQRLFKKLPDICCDINSHLFIIQVLDDAYKKLTGKPISIDY